MCIILFYKRIVKSIVNIISNEMFISIYYIKINYEVKRFVYNNWMKEGVLSHD